MKTISERRKHNSRNKPRTLTERQVARIVTNLRLALVFCDANLKALVDAHPGAGFKRARAALHSPTHVTDESLNQLVFGLAFAVDFITRHYAGGANVLGPAFELLAEIGLMEKEKIVTTKAPPHVETLMGVIAASMNANFIRVEGDHVFVKPDDTNIVVHYTLDERGKLMLAGEIELGGDFNLIEPTKSAPDSYRGPVYVYNNAKVFAVAVPPS
jgi:hypothetical protein